MARATFVKKAQKDIYKRGKRVEYVSQKGKRAGQTLSKIDRTIPCDESDEILIHKGESYYWWAFMNGPVNYSKTQPRQSQLTNSSFLSSLYALQERIGDESAVTKEDFDSLKEEIISEAEDLKSQCEDSLSNMPDSLQYSPTGELLQERIDALENWISELEGVECEDYDEEELTSGIKEENPEASEDELSTLLAEKIEELVSEAMDELQNCSCDF